MAETSSTTAKNTMLDALEPDTLSLHTDDPGAAGTSNELSGGGYSRQSCSFDAAAGGARALSAAVDFTGTANTPADTDNLWVAVWDGAVHLWNIKLDAAGSDTSLNASGEYQVTTDTEIQLTDP